MLDFLNRPGFLALRPLHMGKLALIIILPLCVVEAGLQPKKGWNFMQWASREIGPASRCKAALTLLSFWHHMGIYVEGFTLFDSRKVWVFDGYFCFQYHYVLYIMRGFSYLRCFRMVLTQIITWVCRDSSILTYCSKFLLCLKPTKNPGNKVSRKTELVSIRVNVTLD